MAAFLEKAKQVDLEKIQAECIKQLLPIPRK